MAKAYLVGSGVAALSAAAFLVRDGGFAGGDVHLFEEGREIGGGPTAGGPLRTGHPVSGGRGPEDRFPCTFDLLAGIPSADDPSRSAARDVLDPPGAAQGDAARPVAEGGRILDAPAATLSPRHRLELVACLTKPERLLEDRRISDCFTASFFTTDFWYRWCATAAFRPRHSAVEFHRHLRRFAHLLTGSGTSPGFHPVRYAPDEAAVVGPLTAWLRGHGVTFHTGCRVADLALEPGAGATVRRILFADGREEIRVGPADLVFVTNGRPAAEASSGSHTEAPAAVRTGRSPASWLLWHRLARGRQDFGRPAAFDGSPDDSAAESFTVTARDRTFPDLVETFAGRAPGSGGLLTLTVSPWQLTVGVDRRPVHRDRADDLPGWWGHGLAPARAGTFVPKPMALCTGEEILQEVLRHLPVEAGTADRVRAGSTVVPCLMPYATSPLLVRGHGDRPAVVPKGSTNLAFVGPYADVPDEPVSPVEYAVRTAWTAVAGLARSHRQPPPVPHGHHDPRGDHDPLRPAEASAAPHRG